MDKTLFILSSPDEHARWRRIGTPLSAEPAIARYLDQVADGPGDGLHGPLQVRHGVTILGLLVQDHQSRHLPDQIPSDCRHIQTQPDTQSDTLSDTCCTVRLGHLTDQIPSDTFRYIPPDTVRLISNNKTGHLTGQIHTALPDRDTCRLRYINIQYSCQIGILDGSVLRYVHIHCICT